MKNTIVLKGVKKTFNGRNVLGGISISIQKNAIVSIIGPSGAGKTTLLRIIAGLDTPDEGKITVNGRVGIVFQHCHLWPHKTVEENILEALRTQKTGQKEAEAKVKGLLESLEIKHKAGEFPDLLSGGETQRVAIARTLATEPDVLLLDEITSALDPMLIRSILKCLRSLVRERRTIVLVTHELAFAKEVSDRVMFLSEGRIVEDGNPWKVLTHPEEAETLMFVNSILER